MALILWTILNKPEACNYIKKETLTQVLPLNFAKLFKNIFFIDYFRTAASEILTENSLSNLAPGEKF